MRSEQAPTRDGTGCAKLKIPRWLSVLCATIFPLGFCTALYPGSVQFSGVARRLGFRAK
ncbi:hypothetical protein BKA83DRAFT_681536 [Pisolithus microcarpus]|nr:hypothetical protein BKA83DRAFT_681536 [Pisolithus microcarpus]